MRKHKLSPSEAIFGFTAWLSTREETLLVGSKHECGCLVDLITEFCHINNIEKPRKIFPKNLEMPNMKSKDFMLYTKIIKDYCQS